MKKVDTRWLSLQNCVNCVLEQYQPLISYFESIECARISKERAKAKAKMRSAKKPVTKGYLLALSNILSSIKKFN